jgi:predicted RNA-binding Zn ribbon-like protein
MRSPSRIATIHLIGGRPCLDLVNTVSWRCVLDRREDHLTGQAEALCWSRRAGALSEREASRLDGADVLSPLLALRSALEVNLAGDAARAPDLTGLEPHLRDALDHSHLVIEDAGEARWHVSELDARTAARRVALDLLDLLTDPPGPVRRCDDDECGWIFVDTSRGHRRRWCSSADCGNRARVRAHAARRGVSPDG